MPFGGLLFGRYRLVSGGLSNFRIHRQAVSTRERDLQDAGLRVGHPVALGDAIGVRVQFPLGCRRLPKTPRHESASRASFRMHCYLSPVVKASLVHFNPPQK